MKKDVNAARHRVLRKLAYCYGIQASYLDVFNHRQNATDEGLLQILKTMHAPIENDQDLSPALAQFTQDYWEQNVQPVITVWDDAPARLSLRLSADQANAIIQCHVYFEDGTETQWSEDLATLPAVMNTDVAGKNYLRKIIKIKNKLPYGYHQLFIHFPTHRRHVFVISAPRHFYSHDINVCDKRFGFFAPLYALHTERSFGCGDLTDFKNLITWAAQQNAKLVGTLPFHAAFLDQPCEPSPYSSISRLFWNELYLDVTIIPQFHRDEKLATEINILNASPLVDYKKTMACKRVVLEKMAQAYFASKQNQESLNAFLQINPDAQHYARFRAVHEQYNQPWSAWNIQDLNTAPFAEKNYHYHLFVQWQFHQQLQALSQHTKNLDTMLYLDMPISVHLDSYDTFRYRKDFAMQARIGAPPDMVFTQGQNWGIVPLHPQQIRQSQYEYFIRCLRSIMPFISILRIDHVMGLNRLYWLPQDGQAKNGAYVRYQAEELYAILCIESHRHKVALIGENLGTVPPIVNNMMEKHHLQKMYVLQYELDSNHPIEVKKIPKHAIASLNTHDMPPFTAYQKALDIDMRAKLKLIPNAHVQEEINKRKHIINNLKQTLINQHLIHSHTVSSRELLNACLLLLAMSDANYLLINMEDLWLEILPQNIPTTTEEIENWQRKFRYSLEEIQQLSEIKDLLPSIAKLRPQPHTSSHDIATVSLLSEDDIYLFNEGNHFQLYKKLGAHILTHKGKTGVYFAVWAPNANYVSVIGDFNSWDKHTHPLSARAASGIWERFIPGLKAESKYKYFIHSKYNNFQAEKTDPFGFLQETPPKTASIVCETAYEWQDAEWLKKRHDYQNHHSPMSIYEVHLGSWRRIPEENNRFLTYREIAPLLAEYVMKMGYTHVEFLPLMEHPFYDSWGYQTVGYFAPTSRYGKPQDLMYLIDYLHQHQIGVILDWVPSHFPTDGHGLAFFDGTHLFEHADPRLGFHPDWTSAIFNYKRNEVKSFLISSALFWFDKYHIDGLRIDAVSSMLYLDYSRKAGEWLPNEYGGRENLAAINFMRRLNEEIYKCFPGTQTIAEESTNWGRVSHPTYTGGLGFGYKWDMGWMHDTLRYLSNDPIHRKFHHSEMTFRMLYAFAENFILALSHDEVVHGKGSLLEKMPGLEGDKFANIRLLFGYMYGQPGKKLLFMGDDFAQWREWDNNQSLDWHLLSAKLHVGVQNWVVKLNQIYRQEKALYELDCDTRGFAWVDCNDGNQSIFSFLRQSKDEKEIMLIVINATPIIRHDYRIGVPHLAVWDVLANSDDAHYGGCGRFAQTAVQAQDIPFHGRPFSINITLPPLSTLFFKWRQ